MSVALSVVICSFNRLDCLRDSVAAVVAQLAEHPSAELIVIDDGSTDGTAAWLAAQTARPGVTLLSQPNRGLSAARNHGFTAARGEWIAYLDDDALPSPGWLADLARACAAAPPDVATIGGPVRLQWPHAAPPWLPPSLHEWLTCFEPGGEARTSTTEAFFRGANMACRRTALVAAGGFSERLGRKGGSLISREECDLADRLRTAGWASRYEPEPWVWHRVPAARLRRGWFFRRLHAEGLSQHLTEAATTAPPPLRARARALLYAGKKILVPSLLGRALRFDRPMRQTEALAEICFHAGSARGIWRSAVPR
ncbi:MAG: glycosyltransferase family 2 protein [Verrucomicrobia bacterium]|nr:glycosyltransferase family 2 protein [Verrucomicrobiota bacterium]